MADRDVSASPSPKSAASPKTAMHRAVRRGSVGSSVSASMAARRLSAATTGMGRRHRGQGGPPARSCWSWCRRTFAAHSLWSWCPQANVVSGLEPPFVGSRGTRRSLPVQGFLVLTYHQPTQSPLLLAVGFFCIVLSLVCVDNKILISCTA